MTHFQGRLFAGRLFAGRLWHAPAADPRPPSAVSGPGRSNRKWPAKAPKRRNDDDLVLALLAIMK